MSEKSGIRSAPKNLEWDEKSQIIKQTLNTDYRRKPMMKCRNHAEEFHVVIAIQSVLVKTVFFHEVQIFIQV